ncbi:uncharacterized protein LOC115312223 [Ixodes scapularis]|uniref:uncharacterized protein LOC115312223 n=1 Tax=Ixodes scapularis TaxID=6945 RepID=UPI001A9FB768|nr:uncharacterized protein LOC115312223 [Ixodes scapularis]
MDKFALFRFTDESLAVESVSYIKNFDPVTKHNSKTWPEYRGPTQKNNWVKVVWPDQDHNKRATGTSQVLAAQLVKLSPVRRDLEELLESMLLDTSDEDAAMSKGTSKGASRGALKGTSKTVEKPGKAKSAAFEDRIMERIRLEILQQVNPRMDDQGPCFAAAELRHPQAESRTTQAQAEAELVDTKAKLADAEAKLTEAKAKIAEAEARAAYAEEKCKLFEARAEAAESKVLAAERKALIAVNSLYSVLEGMPGLFEDMKSRMAAGPAVVNAGAAEAGGASLKFGITMFPAIRMVRLNSTAPSVYMQELAEMVFGNETLGRCCLRGSTAGKEALDKSTVDDIIVHVLTKFSNLTESDVRGFLRRKCNNAATALKKNGGG